jgi:glycosyltransferase involved in cell wall biosynthesis
MKVLHLYKDYYPVLGGIENHVRLLAESQAARGHAVTVLVTGPRLRTRVEQRQGVRVIYAGRLGVIASTPLSLALPLGLLRLRPDIAHLHYPYPVGDLAHALFGRARRTVISYHSDIVRQRGLLRLYAPLLRRGLARADAILATSPRYVETSPFLAPIAARCTVVPYGIQAERFMQADPAQVAALRTEYGGGPLLLFVGHLRYYKGVDYLIRAMPAVPGARLLLAGGENSARRAALEALARAEGVAERVVFLGEQDERLPALYHACDIFVLPSIERSEAFAIVQLEAMAASRPVVSCDVGTGVAWVNQHEVTGLVVPPRDPVALAAALNHLQADPALRQKLGAAGCARVQAHFTLDRMLSTVEAVYERVLAARSL